MSRIDFTDHEAAVLAASAIVAGIFACLVWNAQHQVIDILKGELSAQDDANLLRADMAERTLPMGVVR